jgi:hypothetical protein
MLHKIEKTKKMNVLNENDRNEYFLMKFYVEENVFQEKMDDGNMKNLVKWLFV